MLNKEEIEKLIESATESLDKSFVISSKGKGSAVLTDDGDMWGGCIVQNTISGLGTCAERCAIDHAVIHGDYKYKAVATVSKNGVFPCGACLQYLTTFGQINDRDIEIVAANTKGEYKIKKLSELLPERYISKSKDKKIKKYRNK